MNLSRLFLPRFLALALALLAAPPIEAKRGLSPPALCAEAAAAAAQETGVPLRVLLAISLTETGRKTADGTFAPWPWALNQSGDSHWFETAEEALDHLTAALDAGVTNVDVGCFQLNWRWHGSAFASPARMIDPEANALYAARLLARLHADKGDWSAAAGAYHSVTPGYAERYIARFDRIYAALDDGGVIALAGAPPATEEDRRTNGFPLRQAGGAGAMGSLVPLDRAARPLFGG